MKTDVIAVSSKGSQIEQALSQVDKVAEYKGLVGKNALHLRLLAEELMGMLRSITGETEGKFWIEDEDGVYQLHLLAQTDLDPEKRRQLISAATSGKNEAHRGLMGRLRAFFEPTDDLPVFYESATSTLDEFSGDMAWSMQVYREQVMQYLEQKRQGAAEAWDELEKSVVAHVADDVKVSVHGRTVEITISKKMA